MSKWKILIILTAICLVLIALLSVGIVLLVNAIVPKTYSTAKVECVQVLDKYRDELEQIAMDALKSDQHTSGYFKEYYYAEQDENLVQFDVDAQGMLGGQYWGLVYTADGTYYGAVDSYLNKETNGNNIVRAERIDGHWWYIWTDYDGTDASYQ